MAMPASASRYGIVMQKPGGQPTFAKYAQVKARIQREVPL
jgi:hypothetical protein